MNIHIVINTHFVLSCVFPMQTPGILLHVSFPSREELNEKIGGTKQEIERLENELKMVAYHLTKGEQLEIILNRTFKEIEDISDVHQMTNAQLKRIIQKIEVDKDGNVDIYLRIFGDLGLDETVLISDNQT